MEYVYAIIMACMAGGLLLYGGLMTLTGDIKMLQRRFRVSAKMNDPKAYARMLGKTILLCGAAFGLSALCGALTKGQHIWIALLLLLSGLAFAIRYGVKEAKKEP